MDRTFRRIERQFGEMESLIEHHGHRADRVSEWSIGQHLDHLLRADRGILRSVETPSEQSLRPFSTLGRLVLLLRWIPRGKGRAPKSTLPEEPTPESLSAELGRILDLAARLREDTESHESPTLVARHPIFGGMTVAQCWRFMEVHHQHHLKIVHDIRRAIPQ